MTPDTENNSSNEALSDNVNDTNQVVDALDDAMDSKELNSSDTGDTSPAPKAKKIKANKKVKAPRKGGGAVSWLALLIALVAACGSAYNYWQQQKFTQSASANLSQVEDSVTGFKRDLQTEVQSQLNSFSTQSRKLQNEIDDSNTQLAKSLKTNFLELDDRVSENEQQVIKLKGYSDEVKYAYIKSEIEYFLQMANNRINLAQDIGSAKAALEAADERLRIMPDPSLRKVRQEVIGEILALEGVKQPDVERIAITLAGLYKIVPDLPLNTDGDEKEFLDANDIQLKEGEGFRVAMSNVWRNMRGTLDKLVEVRDATPHDIPLLSVENVRLVYANLEIQLQSARLAALKGDAENYKLSLEGATQLLQTYFNTDEEIVKGFSKSLSEISEADLSPELPDISASLVLLRNLRSAEKASTKPVSGP